MQNFAIAVRIWDFLVWVLVIFPLFTGGIWIKQPGLKLELAELGIPVLFVTAIALLLSQTAGTSLKKASSVRFLIWLWRAWEKAMDQNPKLVLWVAAGIVGGLECLASLRRHWAYGSGAADLGIFTNAIWNLTHGNGYVSSVKDGLNLFADHQSPIFWFFAPFFYFFPFPETLLILQAFCLATTGVTLYYLGKQYLPARHWGLAALPLLYWAYLPVRNANAFDFHPEVVMLPLFLAAITGLQRKGTQSRLLGGLALLLGLATKESASPIVVGVGLAWILGAGPHLTRSWTRRLGVLLIFVGVGVFYFDTHVVPQAMGHAYAYDANYQQFGGSGLMNIILAPFTHPKVFWSQLMGPSRLKFLFWTLAPLGFLPLLNWRACVASLPGYLILFLSSGDHRVSPIYHYAIEPSVGLFWALPLALERVTLLEWGGVRSVRNLKAGPNSNYAWWIFWILFWCLACFGRSELYRIRVFKKTDHHRWLDNQVLPCFSQVPASVSGALVPHLANRFWIHHLPQFKVPNQNTELPNLDTQLSNQNTVDCAIYDSEVNNWPLTGEEMRSISQKIESMKFKLEYSCQGLRIYRSVTSVESCLKCVPTCGSDI